MTSAEQKMINDLAGRLGVKAEYLDPSLVLQAAPAPEVGEPPNDSLDALIEEFKNDYDRRMAQLQLTQMAGRLGVKPEYLDPAILKQLPD